MAGEVKAESVFGGESLVSRWFRVLDGTKPMINCWEI